MKLPVCLGKYELTFFKTISDLFHHRLWNGCFVGRRRSAFNLADLVGHQTARFAFISGRGDADGLEARSGSGRVMQRRKDKNLDTCFIHPHISFRPNASPPATAGGSDLYENYDSR